jgi:hypothetical protein
MHKQYGKALQEIIGGTLQKKSEEDITRKKNITKKKKKT